MDYQRTQDLQEQDDFVTRHQANRDDAIDKCSILAEYQAQLIQHLITFEMARDVVEINDVEKVAKGIKNLKELALFVYKDPENDENYFEYNFTGLINMYLVDLGLEVTS